MPCGTASATHTHKYCGYGWISFINYHVVHNHCTQRVSNIYTPAAINVQTLMRSFPFPSFGYTSAAILSTAFVLFWQGILVGALRKKAGIAYPQGKTFTLSVSRRV